MENIILKKVPDTWTEGSFANTSVLIPRNSNEYQNIEKIFKSQGLAVREILRVENVYRFGQYLVRQQLLLRLNGPTKYYQIKRYVKVSLSRVNGALRYQLDSRRLHVNFHFNKQPSDDLGGVIFIVMCTDPNPTSVEFEPTRDSDFYISHIVYFE